MKDESPYKVNPVAERVLDIFLKTVLIICLISSVILALGSIVVAAAEGEGTYLWGILGSAFFALGAAISWAAGKVLINISRNLYNINDALRNGTTPKVEIDTVAIKNEDTDKGEEKDKADSKSEWGFFRNTDKPTENEWGLFRGEDNPTEKKDS